MFKSARVFWKIYYKDRMEQGSSSYFSTFRQLAYQLQMVRIWVRADDCHVDVDVVFYRDNLLDSVTIMGAL